MNKRISLFMLAALITAVFSCFAQTANADELKIVGELSSIVLATDGKSAVATLKDTKTGETIAITITDEQTLDKFKDKRIVEGDEIRAKYEKQDGKNISKIFKKTAGC